LALGLLTCAIRTLRVVIPGGRSSRAKYGGHLYNQGHSGNVSPGVQQPRRGAQRNGRHDSTAPMSSSILPAEAVDCRATNQTKAAGSCGIANPDPPANWTRPSTKPPPIRMRFGLNAVRRRLSPCDGSCRWTKPTGEIGGLGRSGAPSARALQARRWPRLGRAFFEITNDLNSQDCFAQCNDMTISRRHSRRVCYGWYVLALVESNSLR